MNIASVAGLGGAHPDLLQASGYHASKGGVIALTRTWPASGPATACA